MTYKCQLCNYETSDSGNFSHHKKSKKHQLLATKLSYCDNTSKSQADNKTVENYSQSYHSSYHQLSLVIICNRCGREFSHKSNLSRHKKNCKNNLNINTLQSEKAVLEKENELLKKIEREKTEFINTFMANTNTIITKSQDTTKITAQAMQNVSMSALKFANQKYKDAPVLKELENFNINNLCLDDPKDRNSLIELFIYNAKIKTLDKLLGEHIISVYKKENPKARSIHTTDCSRLNYLVRELIKDANNGESVWEVDKAGIKICSKIIKPLIEKCMELLVDHQKKLINEIANGNYKLVDNINTIMSILASIDKGFLELEINKYIAPHFNLIK